MDRDTALEIIREAAPRLRSRYGVVSARLFGSLARGDQDGFSDVDVAVRLEDPSKGSVALRGVSGLLSGLFDSDVDVVVEPTRNSELAAAIERDAILAF